MKTTADVIIIGGGSIGNAAAYYLAKEGVDVIVLEGSDSIGHGGSSRNGGGVRQSGRDVRELPIAMCAVQKFWPSLSDELGVDTEYTRQGNIRMGKTEAHLRKLDTLTTNCRNMGLDVRMIDRKEVHAINPYLSDQVIWRWRRSAGRYGRCGWRTERYSRQIRSCLRLDMPAARS